MHISIIGSTGLIGSRVVEMLAPLHTILEYNSSTGFNIADPVTLEPLKTNKSEWVILLAGKADVDGCELDREKGEESDAWKINVDGPRHIAQICADTGKKLIYISSDFVFDGQKAEKEGYSEDDPPNPINWYGHTKWQGEEVVKQSGAEYIIVRPAYPYRASFDKKNDFMRAIKSRLETNQTVAAVLDHIFCPVFIDDFVTALRVLMEKNQTGIFHTVGSTALTPYDAAMCIAKTFDLPQSLVTSSLRDEYFAEKAKRPFNLRLKNDKINALGVKMKGFEEGLQEIQKQITTQK